MLAFVLFILGEAAAQDDHIMGRAVVTSGLCSPVCLMLVGSLRSVQALRQDPL